jgi:hypothetical protein
MKRTITQVLAFDLLLVIFSGLAFYLQSDSQNVSDESLHFSYIFNLSFTLLFTDLIIILNKKLGQYLGFVFLGQMTLKIILFLFLKKFYIAGTFELTWQVFFLPYLICLLLEVAAILFLLYAKDKKQDFPS